MCRVKVLINKLFRGFHASRNSALVMDGRFAGFPLVGPKTVDFYIFIYFFLAFLTLILYGTTEFIS